MTEIRTRFAPSPTGYLHVGGIRTGLFGWLLARQSSGKFVLRIEDTDKSREVEGSAEHIMRSLKALGLNYDEGPDKEGPYGPYYQSQRLDIYKEWVNKLIDAGRAYPDPYNSDQVEDFRLQSRASKQPFLYRNFRPKTFEKWDGKKPLRFLSQPKAYSWHDEVMGDLSATADVVDDFILIKSDGFPTYNFAHIVDDHLMKISHVIRSQEFIASMPNYLNLYEALEIDQPLFATVPPVLGSDGKKKLSKRDGAKDVLEYLDEGYLPEALVNFMASLGWNDGTEQEVFSPKELIEKFSFAGVQKSGARFDNQRLIWMNGAHIRQLPLDELYDRSKSYFPKSANEFPDDYKKPVLALIQERLKFFSEIAGLTEFFFSDLPVNLNLITDNPKLSSLPKTELTSLLEQTKQALDSSDFTATDLTERLNKLLDQTAQKPAVLFSLIRIATTQSPASPGLFDTLALLGKERSLSRIDGQITALKN